MTGRRPDPPVLRQALGEPASRRARHDVGFAPVLCGKERSTANGEPRDNPLPGGAAAGPATGGREREQERGEGTEFMKAVSIAST